MSKKPRFKPEITRVKLNPEQAVLTCNCYNTGVGVTVGSEPTGKYIGLQAGNICIIGLHGTKGTGFSCSYNPDNPNAKLIEGSGSVSS